MVQIAIVVANVFYIMGFVLGIAAPLGGLGAIATAINPPDNELQRKKRSKRTARTLFNAIKSGIAAYFFVNVANAMMIYISNLPR